MCVEHNETRACVPVWLSGTGREKESRDASTSVFAFRDSAGGWKRWDAIRSRRFFSIEKVIAKERTYSREHHIGNVWHATAAVALITKGCIVLKLLVNVPCISVTRRTADNSFIHTANAHHCYSC